VLLAWLRQMGMSDVIMAVSFERDLMSPQAPQ
jgi:hypothetical protein